MVLAALVLTGLVVDGSPATDGVADGASSAEAADAGPTPDAATPAVEGDRAAVRATQQPEATRATSGPVRKVRRGGAALTALAALRVKGRAQLAGYDRDLFGQAWADVDRNGCDQRNDVLRRDLTVTSSRPGTGGCVVMTGVLDDPYSGNRIDFTRGQDSSMAVQIDHVVALADAWQTGAQGWGPERRETFANDPLVLVAADGSANMQKGASDAASWLPPNKGFRCAYVARQVAIKTKYDLWVKPAEKQAIARVLASCPDQPMPRAGTVAVPTDRMAPAPAPRSERRARSSRRQSRESQDPVVYENCDAVRAAGKAPILRGQPGYSSALDRDGDGQGCDT